MKIRLIRHAAVIIYLNGRKILIDPMLNKKGTLAPIEGVPNMAANPLTELPIPVENITDCDAVIVTHLHSDHFNPESAEFLNKSLPLFCQPQDYEALKGMGFVNVHAVSDNLEWEGIIIYHTGGRHGYGVIAKKMAPVSGFIIKSTKGAFSLCNG